MAVEVGSVVEGKISGITNFGAFVDLGGGESGMVHISEVSKEFIKDIREHLSVGQEIRVRVLAKSPEGKISLSIKQAEEQPARRERTERPRNTSPQRSGNYDFSPKQKDNMSFEDMMSSFKKSSDEKMYDLKKVIDNRRGSQNRRSRQP